MKLKIAIALLIFALCITTAYATLITPPSQIQLNGGTESNGKWTGGYWSFTVAVDQADNLTGHIVLPMNTSVSFDNSTKILTNSTVEIDVTPSRAYYKRSLKLMSIYDRVVAPATYGGGLNVWGIVGPDKEKSIGATVVDTYTWAEQAWQKFTVFSVSVAVNGHLVGQGELNTEQGVKTLVVPTSKGDVLIKNLGRLEGDYSEPDSPEIVIFDNRYIYAIDALNYIRYDHGRTFKPFLAQNSLLGFIDDSEAFSTYWFGTARWNPPSIPETYLHNTPAPFISCGSYVVIADPIRGWRTNDYFGGWGRVPVEPNIFPENGSDSLIEYLNMKTSSGNIANSWLSGFNWKFEYTNSQPTAVIVDLPWGAYSGSPVVTCFVPTELADTWIYHPPIANAKILQSRWTDDNQIIDNASCTITLRQDAQVTSSVFILADTSDKASVSPHSITSTLQPNETQSFTFQVFNLGVSEDTVGQVHFRILRAWDGVQTDSTSLQFTLLKPKMPENLTELINRPPYVNPLPNSIPEYNDNSAWLLAIVFVCVTVILVFLIKKYPNRVKATTIQTKLFAEKVATSVWRQYAPELSVLIVGTMLFIGGLLWQSFMPLSFLGINLLFAQTSWVVLGLCFFGGLLILLGINAFVMKTPLRHVTKLVSRL